MPEAVRIEDESPQGLDESWWDAPWSAIDANGCQAEIALVNALGKELAAIPEWALKVRESMPRWGFEICAHRWLEGLGDLLRMIGSESHFPSTAGHCGDIPGTVLEGAYRRAVAVEAWLKYRPANDRYKAWVYEVMGRRTPEKRQAARCFVNMVRARFGPCSETDLLAETVSFWRESYGGNKAIEFMLEEQGLRGLLQNACGYRLITGLDDAIRCMGDPAKAHESTPGQCNGQLRFVWGEDPDRYKVTRGYLWGLFARLVDWTEDELWEERPGCVGAATHALREVARPGNLTPLRRWLVASLLVTTKLWCHRAIEISEPGAVPAWAYDLPQLA